MTDGIFDDQTPEVKFDDLVGEGKKYSDAEAAAKAIVEKDRFIERLLQEARQKEADFQAQANLREFKDRLERLENVRQADPPEPPRVEAPAPSSTPDIEDLISKKLEAREQEVIRSRNLIAVKEKLTDALGADYTTYVKQRAAELQISMDEVNRLAATAPSALYSLLGLDAGRPVPSAAPPATQRNAAAFVPSANTKNYAYFQNLRKTNPSLYWTPAVQLEEWNEAKRQGESFGA